MGYLFAEIALYLVGAGIIGFAFGWAVRDGVLDKYFEKFIEFFKKAKEAEGSVPETKESVKEESIEKVSEAVTAEPKKEVSVEIMKEEISVVEVSTESNKPALFTKVPDEGQDKLSSLKGLGPVMEKKLNELGVYTFSQMASWSLEQALWIGTELSSPKKVTKEQWVEQAKELLATK